MNPANEVAFEAHVTGGISSRLGTRRVKIGSVPGESDFDPAASVDTVDRLAFITATQQEEGNRLVDCGDGGDPPLTRAKFVQRQASQLNKGGG